jgi:carbonic anhydrase/acetyltransferase-like protein (isoleucine patch superfamily)
MSKPLVFVGYKGDMGLFIEVCDIQNIPIKGILDSNFLHEQEIDGIPMLGSEYDLEGPLSHLLDECDFFISSGFTGVKNADDPEKSGDLIRIERINLLERLGASFKTLIHPTAVLDSTATVGAGSYVGLFTHLGRKATIGRHSLLQHGAVVGHHVVTGVNFLTGPRIVAGGYTTFGDNVYMGPLSCTYEGHWKSPLTIGNNSMIHMGVICLVNVPDNTTVGLHGKMFKRYESPQIPDIIVTKIARTRGE